MRVVVTGASGNVGTSLLKLLVDDPIVTSVGGVARRVGDAMPFPEVEWTAADVATTDLRPVFDGAEAVVHLAWAIQPSRDGARLWRTNVLGSRRVFEAAAAVGVPSLLYASSVGAYSPGPKEPRVDESWPTDGIPTSFYSRHKATVEWMLDRFEEMHPETRVARLRPALIFKREAASGIRRLFLGKLFPTWLLHPRRLPRLPVPAGLRLQAVHSKDVAAAFLALAKSEATGPFNVSAEPVLDGQMIAELLGTRPVPVPWRLLRAAAAASWRAHFQPTPEGWLDMAAEVPHLDCSRARRELGWRPTVDAARTTRELIDGLVDMVEFPTPALSRWGRPIPSSAPSPPRPAGLQRA